VEYDSYGAMVRKLQVEPTAKGNFTRLLDNVLIKVSLRSMKWCLHKADNLTLDVAFRTFLRVSLAPFDETLPSSSVSLYKLTLSYLMLYLFILLASLLSRDGVFAVLLSLAR